jgi:hypothetical protein
MNNLYVNRPPPSQPIMIKITTKTPNHNTTEYGVTYNTFDPTNNTPPDNFIHKLETRMKDYYYYSLSTSNYLSKTSSL